MRMASRCATQLWQAQQFLKQLRKAAACLRTNKVLRHIMAYLWRSFMCEAGSAKAPSLNVFSNRASPCHPAGA